MLTSVYTLTPSMKSKARLRDLARNELERRAAVGDDAVLEAANVELGTERLQPRAFHPRVHHES